MHRDLKPANIKITPAGTVKLLDFGLAKADGPWTTGTSVEDAPTIAVTTTGAGMILGTAAYMAPEQARGRNVDKRADIWAFGVILYEMLTGEQMFEGETVTDVLASVVRQDPDLKRVPEKVRPLLQRCLEKDPKRRLRDAGDAMLLLDTTPAAATAAAAPSSKAPLWALGGVAALLAIALGALSYVHVRETPQAPEVVRFEAPLPDEVNFTQYGVSSMSPDGRKIAFAAFGNDSTPRIWIRSFDSGTTRVLEEARITQQSFPFAWSPDSRFVLYEFEGKLRRVDITGGPPEVMADVPAMAGGSWHPNGTILIGTVGGIMKIPASGGTPTFVTKATKEENNVHVYPTFLPDGRHFLFMRGTPPGKRGIFVGDLEAAADAQSTTSILSTDYGVALAQASASAPPMVLFMRNNSVFAQPFDMRSLALSGEAVTVADQVIGILNLALGYFSASKTGALAYRSITGTNRQLTWFNRQGEPIGRAGERAPYGTMKLSPDGARAVVVQNDPRQPGNSDLWIVDLTSGVSTRFTFNPGADSQPVWSPDGRYVAWQSRRNQNDPWGLYRKAADGSGVDELLGAPKGVNNLTDWTHNGFLIFTIGGDIYALPVTPTRPETGRRSPSFSRRPGSALDTSLRITAGSPTCQPRPGAKRSMSSRFPSAAARRQGSIRSPGARGAWLAGAPTAGS